MGCIIGGLMGSLLKRLPITVCVHEVLRHPLLFFGDVLVRGWGKKLMGSSFVGWVVYLEETWRILGYSGLDLAA
jgi:hypothetical protein